MCTVPVRLSFCMCATDTYQKCPPPLPPSHNHSSPHVTFTTHHLDMYKNH
jgi:hypothetical protein